MRKIRGSRRSTEVDTMHIKANIIKTQTAPELGEARRTEYDQSALETLKYLKLIHQGRDKLPIDSKKNEPVSG
jgi:hypothetical protein